MTAAPPAARLNDPVAHSHALAGFVAGAVVGLAATMVAAVAISAVVGAVALEVGTAGLATPLIVGVAATAVEFGVTAYVGTKLTGFAEETGEALGGESMGAPSGKVAQGSTNVLTNSRPAARAGDAETCDAGIVAQGSCSVVINGKPAARVGDKTSCGGKIVEGSGNVFIGGPPVAVAPIQSEVPEWVRWAAIVVGILPALGQAARAIGPALAEIEATGFARAAQTGAKALGRAMEKRGGGGKTGLAYHPNVVETAKRLEIPPSKVQEIIDTPKPSRPAPETYVSRERMTQHADAFKDGGSRITLQENLDKYGLGQRDGTTFISTKSDTDQMLAQAGGDPRKLEDALGLPRGQLDDAKLVRVDFTPDAMRDMNVRMPSGSEAGANENWLPGGYLPNGQNEAVIDGINALPEHYNKMVLNP